MGRTRLMHDDTTLCVFAVYKDMLVISEYADKHLIFIRLYLVNLFGRDDLIATSTITKCGEMCYPISPHELLILLEKGFQYYSYC